EVEPHAAQEREGTPGGDRSGRSIHAEGDRMPKLHPTDETLRALLREARAIAMVGASSNPARPSHRVMRTLLAAGYPVIPVNPRETEVHGRRAYATLADVPEPIDVVDVFRRSEHAPAIAAEAVAIGAKA